MLDELENELRKELTIIYQQRSLDANEMDEIDQSENLGQNQISGDKKLNNFQNETKYRCLAETQKREKFEKLVKETNGNYYFYQLDDETNSFLDPL